MAVTVSLNPTTAALKAGDTQQLTPTVTGGTSGVTYSSSNAAVATVNASGLITAIKSGTATITATSVDDNTKTATCAVTATLKVVVPVIAFSALPQEKTLVAATAAGFLADATLSFALHSGHGSVASSGVYEAGLEGTDVVRVTSNEDNTQYVDVTITVADIVSDAHRVHLADAENSLIQSLIVREMQIVDRTSPLMALLKSALANLTKFGN